MLTIRRGIYRWQFIFVAVAMFALSSSDAAEPLDAAKVEFFEKRIRPLLLEQCVKCHGAQKQMSGLRLDSRDAALRGGENGLGITPGDPAASGLLLAIQHRAEIKMPPEKRLPDDVIANFSHWIQQGATWPAAASAATSASSDAWKKHWAFQPIGNPVSPEVRDVQWPRDPLDRFVLEKHERHAVRPTPPAERRAWLRRLTFDLTGLPPTSDNVERFMANSAPDAEHREVDRLLASPRLGERWARHWLDVARYADTKGYVIFGGTEFPWAYTYRDYVIRAFNEDLPFDQFVVEQLAADRFDSPRHPAALAGLGFLTVGPRFIDNAYDILDDRIDVVTRGLMGLTVSCARCHDHKFDPIPSRDYYSLYGVLASCVEPIVPPLLASPPETDGYREFDRELQVRAAKLRDFLQEKHAALVKGARRRVAEYLMAVYELQDKPRQDDFMLLADGNDINPSMIMRWQSYLRDAKRRGEPIFAAWHALASLSPVEFATQRDDRLRSLSANSKWPAQNAIVELLKQANAQSIADVAKVYGDLFAAVDEKWERFQQENPQATGLPEPLDEQIRQLLYAPHTPPLVPLHPLGDLELLPDRKSQGTWKELLKAIETHRAAGPHAPPRSMSLVDLAQPVEPHVFVRGNPNQPADLVPRQFLGLFASLHGREPTPFREGAGRLEMARQIVAADNPLTPRVFVNRVWSKFFGRGLVATASDFGLRSDPPTHPELLDHLARSFQDRGWSVKELQRRIVLSATYRQGAQSAVEGAAAPVLWNFVPRRRLEFEALRDSLLSVSGTLDAHLGGVSVKDTLGPGGRRRTLYGFLDRHQVPGTYRAFDFPSPDSTSPQRDVTTVSPQSLFLMNHPLVLQNARRVLLRPEIAGEKERDVRVERVYAAILSRPPTAREKSFSTEFLGAAPTPAIWERFCHALVMSNEFSYLD